MRIRRVGDRRKFLLISIVKIANLLTDVNTVWQTFRNESTQS